MKARPSDSIRSLTGTLLGLTASLFYCPLLSAQQAVIHSFTGTVLLERLPAGPWSPLQLVPERIDIGGMVKVGSDGAAEIRFADKSRVVVEPNGVFSLDDGDKRQDHVTLSVGSLRAWIHPAEEPHFYVRTPTAVCTIRGTRFAVTVANDGSTTVELFDGKLSVADLKGHELLLQAGQRVEVHDVLGAPEALSKEALLGDHKNPPSSLDSFANANASGGLNSQLSAEVNREQWRQANGRQVVAGLQPLGAAFVDTKSPPPVPAQ